MTEKQYLAKLRNLARQHVRNCCSYRSAEVARLIQTFIAVAEATRQRIAAEQRS